MSLNCMILFAHGSRDRRWAQPFEHLRDKVARRVSSEVRVVLAFLEVMQPDLPQAVNDAIAAGCRSIDVIPVFLGEGGHVRRDLPALVASLSARHPETAIRVATAVGEDDGVLNALAAYCLQAAFPDTRIP
jgi:sirohydrochlorin cobaltochelatase